MRFIVAVDSRWGIGKDNDLLKSIPDDMMYYRKTTRDKVVLMGYRTLLSLPQSKPQPARLNIVLADIEGLSVSGAVVCKSMDQLLRLAGCFKSEDVFVIGGGSIYRQLMPYCEGAHITKMRFDGGADTFIPDLDEKPEWSVINESDISDYEGVRYSFAEYRNSSPLPIRYAAELSESMSDYFKKKEELILDLPGDPDEERKAELKAMLTAYFCPLRDGFTADDVEGYLSTGPEMSFEKYLKKAGLIAAKEDIEAFIRECSSDNSEAKCQLRVTKENLAELFG